VRTARAIAARLLRCVAAENPIDRYSIGGRTPGIKQGSDGSLEIYLQNDHPGSDKTPNWLPTPKGPFFLIRRINGPQPALIDGTWKAPLLVERNQEN
jgi:hypothetical protein